MQCPSCGAEIESDNRFAHMIVCDFCNSAVIADEAAARVSGKMSVLPAADTPFFVGTTGSVLERSFTVLGRVRYGYDKGYWDEWYLLFEDESVGWLTEDLDGYSLENCESLDAPIDYALLNPGDTITIGDYNCQIIEKGVAECEGGQGQLPFEILSGDKTPYLELKLDNGVASLEFNTDEQTCRFFVGQPLNKDDVELDVTAQEAGIQEIAADKEASESSRGRVVRSDKRAESITCFSCGAPLETPSLDAESMSCDYCGCELDLTIRREACKGCGATLPVHGGTEAKTVTCSFCDSQMDLSSSEPTLLGKLASEKRPKTPFKPGQTCQFDDVQYQVVGYLRYKDGSYYWNEFLLHSKDVGYRWFVEDRGHYSLGAKTEKIPKNRWNSHRQMPFTFEHRSYQPYDVGKATVTYVEGELPWVAQINDQVKYYDAACPPYLLSIEETPKEVECFVAEYKSAEEVSSAFHIPLSELPVQCGIAPNMPYPAGPGRRTLPRTCGTAAAICLVLAVLAFMSGKEAGSTKLLPEDYATEHLTPTFFETKKPNALCKIRFKAPVDNSWIYLDAAIVNEKKEVVLDFSSQISYYHGRSGGENWREGSRKDSELFKLKTPGKYGLLVKGQAGAGNRGTNTKRHGKPVQAKVFSGISLARYYILGAILFSIVALIEVIRRHNFKTIRSNPDIDSLQDLQ